MYNILILNIQKLVGIVINENNNVIHYGVLFNGFEHGNLLKCQCLSNENYINVIILD